MYCIFVYPMIQILIKLIMTDSIKVNYDRFDYWAIHKYSIFVLVIIIHIES